MSYCLNPYCANPQNPEAARFCTSCGFRLLLGDRYRSTKPIGQGGFGRTFLAVDEYKPSRPQCVIKQFFPQRQSAHDLERARELFLREAIQLERLGSHPQIPELLAHFEQAQYQYLVQEYIEGANLLQVVGQQGAFSDRQVWQLLMDLLPVLEYVHQHQVIHRDIKPQNIIRRIETQHYVLVDFGAAKSIGGEDLPRTGTSIGSPEFTPPEQAIGKATYASDLYSLGVTCLYLLTGMRPADLYDTEEGMWNWQPRVARPIHTVLGQVLDKLLQGPVKRRYASASAVLQDLQHPDLLAALELKDVELQGLVLPVADLEAVDLAAADLQAAELASPDRLDDSTESSAVELVENSPPEFAPTQAPPSQLFQPRDRWICTHTLTGHRNWVRSLIIHPDGQTLASGSGDKTIRIWRLDTGELLREIVAHDSWVRALALSPDARLLASASNDRTIKLWIWQTGDLWQTLTGHTDWVRAIAFSPDGRLLFSGSQDKTIRIWQMPTGRPLQAFTGHQHWVVSLVCGKTDAGDLCVISGSRDTTIRVWNGRDGRVLQTLTGHKATVNTLILTPDGKTLISGSDDGTICLWDWQTGKCLQTLMGENSAVHGLAVSADGKWLLSSGQDKTLKIWDLPTRLLQHTLSGHLGWIWAIAISADQQTIASGSWDATVKLWRKND